MKRRFFCIFLLIFMVGFLFWPKISLAEIFEEITPEEIGQYLQLSRKDTYDLWDTLIQVFTNEWISQECSGYSTPEERAVPIILREVARIDALNHLLIDAPVEVTGKIIKNTIEIARLFLAKDISVVLDKFERETVEKATEYGMKFLLQNELRVTPGAVKFKYTSYKGDKKEVVFQYIIVYQPLNQEKGEVKIRFYSSESIEPPESKGS